MILHIDCNTFYASCEVALRPDLKGKPVAVANCNEAGGGIILALTKEAKALGLKRGDPVFKVKEILNRNNVAVFPSNLYKYVDISRRIMQIVKEMELDENEKELLEHCIVQMETEANLDRNAALADMRYTFIETVVQASVVTVKPLGAPRRAGSSEKEYWVFAMQMGRSPKPSSVSFAACFLVPAVSITPSAW